MYVKNSIYYKCIENIKKKLIVYIISSNKLQTIYWAFCKLIKYDLCKPLIIEWDKEFHNFGPWYKIVNFFMLVLPEWGYVQCIWLS